MKVAQYENTDYEPFLPPTRASLLPMFRFILIGLIFTSILIGSERSIRFFSQSLRAGGYKNIDIVTAPVHVCL